MICAAISLLLLMGARQAAATQDAPAPSATKPTAYDVVSIRQNKSGAMNSNVRFPPNGLTMTNMPLMQLFMSAFGPRDQRSISGLPDWTGWMSSTRFDVVAKMDENTFAAIKKLPPEEATQERKQMVEQLLVDRFKLKVHHEQKELPVYALVVAKGGSKLKDADPSLHTSPGAEYHPGRTSQKDGELSGDAIGIDNLVRYLSALSDRQVVNQTGLTGKYDIKLKWLPVQASQDNERTDLDASRASIFTAVQEQLGLKLESTKAMTDMIVVDHIEMPSEN
jgi:uncharacterized protein (TIGR03435 family)